MTDKSTYQNTLLPPIAHLVGTTETAGEHHACSLVFTMETKKGKTYELTYGALMKALRFAEQEKVIPPLSPHWWARIGNTDGCPL